MRNSDAVLDALNDARHTRQLYMVYQPIFDLRTNRISGFEALMRWNSPVMGMVSPEVFIALLENSGQLLPVEEMVVKTPWETAAAWPEPLSLSINFSALELCEPGLPDRVKRNLAAFGLPPHRCVIELTETQPLPDTETAMRNMLTLKASGIKFALDDFGTGHANLDNLRRYPFDTLKIDKSFMAGIEQDPKSARIVRGIINLAHDFGIEALAEGVENHMQLTWLRNNGCDKAQGFYLSPPVTAEEIPQLLIQHS